MTDSADQNTITDIRVRSAVYDSFISRGAAISRAEAADRLSLSARQVAAAYQRLAEAHMLVLQPGSGEVLMANPFSAVPTAFRVSSGERAWWGNCIWDALGILVMTNRDGTVETACPDCGEGLTLRVAGGELESAPVVVQFTVPAAHWWDDIVFT